MELESDFKGIKGVLPPSGEWQTVHRGIVRRTYDIETSLPDGARTMKYTGVIADRWVQSEERWELQLLNRGPDPVSFHLRWYVPASERLCCGDYGRQE